ncbi:uncharacterized protein LOC144100138 [Amblyomma americanum]
MMNVPLTSVMSISVAVVRVWAVPELNCSDVTCPTSCPPLNCSCGEHHDGCRCCNICNKCANEVCTIIPDDPCLEEHFCQLDNPNEDFHTGGMGHCKPFPENENDDADDADDTNDADVR